MTAATTPSRAAIHEAQARLDNALETGDIAQFAALAAERHRSIVAYFESAPGTGAERLQLLRELLAANNRMLETGRTQLQEAAALAVASQHSRRAIRAYRERGDNET